MRLEVRDVSLSSVLKVGCCVHAVIASIPAVGVTLLTLAEVRVLVDPTREGLLLATGYLAIMFWIIVSIVAGGIAWVVLAVVYNLVASAVGGVVVDLRRAEPKPAPDEQAEPVRSRYEDADSSLP